MLETINQEEEMNAKKVIVGLRKVKEDPWEGPNGAMWFVEGSFDDDSTFSRGAKSLDNALALHTLLEGLVGYEHQFEIEDSGREYQGRKKWNLKGWPGKPERPGFGGGGGGGGSGGSKYVPRHRDTAEGSAEEGKRIFRNVALQQAVAARDTTVDRAGLLELADHFYAWLTADMQPLSKEPSAFERYKEEVGKARKAKDIARLDQIQAMVVKSLDKQSVSIDEATEIDDLLQSAKKGLASAANHSEWTSKKLAEARAREPLHPDPKQNSFLQQAEEVF